jgi:hypothetical protein
VKRTKEKKAKDRQRSKKLKKLLCLFSFCEKKGLSDDDEKEKQKKLFKKESAPLEKKHSLSLSVETNTPNARREKQQFSAEKTKKKSQISRHKTDPRRHFILT